jgi:hypothetical protein
VNLGTPNKPLEWTGHHQLFTGPAQIHCLPLRASVRRMCGPNGSRCEVEGA